MNDKPADRVSAQARAAPSTAHAPARAQASGLPVTALARAAFWLATAVVVVTSLLPGPYLPKGGIFDLWDKAQHALAFAVLALLGLWSWRPRALRVRLVVGLLALGGVIEVAQHLSGWRHGDWADWLADSLGVLVAILVCKAGALALLRRTDAP